MSELALIDPSNIDEFERAVLAVPQVPCPVIHTFGPGIYIREVRIPAGTFACGHWQNFPHQNIVLKGAVRVKREDGSELEIRAPFMYTGEPGRKVGLVIEDLVWLNVYPTDIRDVEKLESILLSKNENWDAAHLVNMHRRAAYSEVDRSSYFIALAEMDVTEDTVRAQSEVTADLIPLPYGSYKCKTGPSPIEGRGLFASANIASGEVICPARIDGKRTIAGRYTNHGAEPNARFVARAGSDVDLIAICDILGCHGGLDGEEITVDYREAFKLNRSLQCQE